MPTNQTIEQLFNGIAPNYDKMNHLMSFNADRRWRRVAVRHITNNSGPLHILDLATGTGDFAIAIAKELSNGGSVTGLDLSDGMLAIGRQKVLAEKRKLPVDFHKGNAEAIPYDDNTYDRVSIAFGVRNYENLDQGLSEAYRVLNDNGRLVILELSYPDNPILLWAYKLYTLKVLPWLGGLISGHREAYTYLPESILKFPKGKSFLSRLQKAGFQNCREQTFTFGVCRLYVAEKK